MKVQKRSYKERKTKEMLELSRDDVQGMGQMERWKMMKNKCVERRE